MDWIEIIGTTLAIMLPSLAATWWHFNARLNYDDHKRNLLSDRMATIEASIVTDIPIWIRDSKGVFQSVSPEFIRLFGMPRGLSQKDFIGKRFEEIPGFSQEIVTKLSELDKNAIRNTYACASGVELFDGVKATIMKFVRHSGADHVFVGFAVPEFD